MKEPVALLGLAGVFLRLGATSFGSSMLPLMEEAVVERRRWLTPTQFLEAISLAELTPGPVALKVAAYVGSSLRGFKGALVTVGCFSLPSFLLVVLASMLFFVRGGVLPVEKLLRWVGPVVVGTLLATAWRLGKRCLVKPSRFGIALAAFLALQAGWSPLLVLWGLGLFGVIWGNLRGFSL